MPLEADTDKLLEELSSNIPPLLAYEEHVQRSLATLARRADVDWIFAIYPDRYRIWFGIGMRDVGDKSREHDYLLTTMVKLGLFNREGDLVVGAPAIHRRGQLVRDDELGLAADPMNTSPENLVKIKEFLRFTCRQAVADSLVFMKLRNTV